MAGEQRFHNKFHKKSHHTNPTAGYPDSGSDPIASPAEPFQGDFVVNGTLSTNAGLSFLSANIPGNVNVNSLFASNIVYANQLSGYGTEAVFSDSALAAGNGNNTLTINYLSGIYLTSPMTTLSGDAFITGNMLIVGNISALGDLSYIDTNIVSTSALSVNNFGVGPAFVVNQNNINFPIARFQNVGTVRFELSGNFATFNSIISSNQNLVAPNISTLQSISSVYSTVNTNSANDWYAGRQFLLSGGNVAGAVRINNTLVVNYLSALSGASFVNTTFTTTSSLCVVGTLNSGPVLYVAGNGSGDLASFYDLDTGIEMLHIGESNSTFPNVGIKVSNPTKTLTVSGEISALNDVWFGSRIYSNNENLTAIFASKLSADSVYSTVSSNSANWRNTYATVSSSSANWNNTYATVSSNSANWNNTYNTVSSNSARWTNAYSSVTASSANWNNTYATVSTSSANWNNTYATVSSNSASWAGGGTVFTTVNSNSSNWQNTYATVSANSATWSAGGGGGGTATNTVSSFSASWNNTYNTVSSNSANWNSTYNTVSSNSALWGGRGQMTLSGTLTLSGGTTSNPPLSIVNTVLKTTPSAGDVEWDGYKLYTTSLSNNVQARNSMAYDRETVTLLTTTRNLINIDLATSFVVYSLSCIGSFGLNVRWNSLSSLNSVMPIGQSSTFVFMNTNTSITYNLTGFNVDGTLQTVKWLNGTGSIPASNAYYIDSYTFNIIKTANNTYTVLGSQNKYI